MKEQDVWDVQEKNDGTTTQARHEPAAPEPLRVQKNEGEHRIMSNRHYPDDPRVGVGAFVVNNGSVLLVRRKGEPAAGLWAIPGGNLMLGETIAECAEREIAEETGITIRAGKVIHTFEIIDKDEEGRIRFHYVVLDVVGEYISGEPLAADDALDARWVSPGELPAFPLARTTIEFFKIIPFP
jgi:ADP-ribose pyrophosphatase